MDFVPSVKNKFIKSSFSSRSTIRKSILSETSAILFITGSTCAASPHQLSERTNQIDSLDKFSKTNFTSATTCMVLSKRCIRDSFSLV